MDLKNIQDNTIIICENNYKNKILQELENQHLFLNIKFFTKKEFLQEYIFKYSEEAIFML